jgi:hypothetical protein
MIHHNVLTYFGKNLKNYIYPRNHQFNYLSLHYRYSK